MKTRIVRGLVGSLLLGVLLCVPRIASADGGDPVVLWTLSGVTFASATATGGTATGSFDYNSATNTFSNISIVTTAGSGFGGATYTTLSGAFPSFPVSMFLGASSGDFTGTPLLALFFDSALVNSGGTVTIPLTLGGVASAGGEGTCDNADCSSSTEDRFITAGTVSSTVATTIPEPSTLLLLGVGIAGLLGLAAIRKVS